MYRRIVFNRHCPGSAGICTNLKQVCNSKFCIARHRYASLVRSSLTYKQVFDRYLAIVFNIDKRRTSAIVGNSNCVGKVQFAIAGNGYLSFALVANSRISVHIYLAARNIDNTGSVCIITRLKRIRRNRSIGNVKRSLRIARISNIKICVIGNRSSVDVKRSKTIVSNNQVAGICQRRARFYSKRSWSVSGVFSNTHAGNREIRAVFERQRRFPNSITVSKVNISKRH